MAIITKRKEDHIIEEELLVKCIILDFSAVTYIDPAGTRLLSDLASEYKELNIALYIANCSGT